MKTLRLRHGDLVPGSGGVETVTGAPMLIQDMRAALGEPMGNDRFHPGWGSVIDEFIGAPLDEATRFDVEQEVNRVVGNYMAVQEDNLRRDAMSDRAPRYSSADVIAQVREVKVEARQDRIGITIVIETMNREEAVIQTEVNA